MNSILTFILYSYFKYNKTQLSNERLGKQNKLLKEMKARVSPNRVGSNSARGWRSGAARGAGGGSVVRAI